MQAEWTTIRDRLLKTVGQNNFTTWIDPLTVGPIEDGICTLFVPTNFFGNYVSPVSYTHLTLPTIYSV